MKRKLLLLIIVSLANTAFAQSPKDSSDGRFHDDLLDKLAGTWNVTSVAHNFSSTAVITAGWVLNHQFFHLRFKGNDTIPWWHMPMEFEEFFGYNRSKKRYHFHGMSIEGDADQSEGFGYAYRTGNQFKTVAKMSADTAIIQLFIWQPENNTWIIQSKEEIGGKEGSEVFLEMRLVAVKASSNK